MSRRVAWCLAALALLARGADEERPKPADELMKERLAPYVAMVEFVASARLSEAGLKSVIAHYGSFRKVYEGKEGDRDTPASRVTAHLEKTALYDFSLDPKMREVRAWAAAKKLDATAWLRLVHRAQLLQTRKDLAEGLDAYRKEVEKLEKLAEELEFDDVRAAAAEGRWILTLTEKTIKLIPAPTATEKQALERHAKALRAVLGAGGKSGDSKTPPGD